MTDKEREIMEAEEKFLRASEELISREIGDAYDEDEDEPINQVLKAFATPKRIPKSDIYNDFDQRPKNYSTFTQKPKVWSPNCSILCMNIIQEIIKNKYRVPGRLIKILFDEIQKGTKDPTIYTKFFLRYVVGSKNHRPLKDDTFYQLVFNHNDELIASTVKDARQNGMPLHEKEIAARRLAVYLHDIVDDQDSWGDEVSIVTDIDGNEESEYHEWSEPIHDKYVKRARYILYGYHANSINEEEEK